MSLFYTLCHIINSVIINCIKYVKSNQYDQYGWRDGAGLGGVAQSSTLYMYYIELACTQSPFFQDLPYKCTASVQDVNKEIKFWLSAPIGRAYPGNLQLL